MPERQAKARAARDRREEKAATTQAGEFVREEMRQVGRGKPGASSRKQAIAIGLSKARRAGVKLGAPKRAPAAKKKAPKPAASRARTGAAKRGSARKRTGSTGGKKR